MSEQEEDIQVGPELGGSFTWVEDHSISVPGSMQVLFPKMFAIERGGRVVASVDGVFDFKDVRTEYQWQLLNLMRGRSLTLVYPQRAPVAKKEETPRRPPSLWERVLSWISPTRVSSLP